MSARPQNPLQTMQQALSALAWVDEAKAVQECLAQLAPVEALEEKIQARAASLVSSLRAQGAGSGMEAFLHEYGLGTREGIAILCLAEALLRIPDPRTANQLIHDKLGHADWDRHLGGSESLFVNASSWGLFLTGKLTQWTESDDEKASGAVTSLAAKLGDSLVRSALTQGMRLIGGRFVMGEKITDAIKNAGSYTPRGYRMSYDMLGEGARSQTQSDHYYRAYSEAIAHLAEYAEGCALYNAPGISIKLSALHPRYQFQQRDRVMSELLPRLKSLVSQAMEAGVTVALDAEESTRLDMQMEVFSALFSDPVFAEWEGLGFVVQAYQKRALALVEWLAVLSRINRRRMPVRLVKGAYWDAEIKWAQQSGHPAHPVFTRKEHTDVSYLACAEKLLAAPECFYPQFATHNARTVASIEALAASYGIPPGGYEFQRLHGMGEKLHELLLSDGAHSRIYAPVGEHRDLLAYLIRRLLENGANSSFVNLLMDRSLTTDEIIADPIKITRENGAEKNHYIPLPRRVYGNLRLNSEGLDFGNLAQWSALQAALKPYRYSPLSAIHESSSDEVHRAVSAAHAAQKSWSVMGVSHRARVLEKAADILELHRAELMALLAQEAGKTYADSLAEVREAVDFCRYYAQQARTLMDNPLALPGPTGEKNELHLYPRGVFACISPWNFPLAIFVGQVVAALATGNAALAKPAGQTPCIAARTVELLHEAGVPRDALILLNGSGATIGAALIEHNDVNGVVFTGSVETAQRINRALAARTGPIVPFIAETGGQNCMVVDSSALLEQAVDDIIASAFGSAGQRCSALRVLFVQEEVANALLDLLAGAMRELRMGCPLSLSTDIGPVIDAAAKATLDEHIARMKTEARLIAATPLPDELPEGSFVAPHAFEIPDISVLEREVFGPVLHVVRFQSTAMQRVADAVNSTGYGLTFGIHSRIDAHVDFFRSRIRAGNIYVNRGMTGAVVGVQPFGGEGLSGTGPKAGGPHYLLRFLTERTLTTNTAALGGNISLLTRDTP